MPDLADLRACGMRDIWAAYACSAAVNGCNAAVLLGLQLSDLLEPVEERGRLWAPLRVVGACSKMQAPLEPGASYNQGGFGYTCRLRHGTVCVRSMMARHVLQTMYTHMLNLTP